MKTVFARSPLALALLFPLLACETDLGRVCDDDPAFVRILFDETDEEGTAIVADVRLDNCASALCLQQAGAEPFCTRRCIDDQECNDAPGFTCRRVIAFGREGCQDFQSNPDCIDEDGSLSDQAIKHCVRAELL